MALLPDGDTAFSDVSSVATAYVTGIAALLKSYNPDLTSTQIAHIIRTGSKKIKNLEGLVASGGIIDAYECLIMAQQ